MLSTWTYIGQKVANEFLRQVADVLELRPEWVPELDVALDTHVVKTLVKTGAIELDASERDRSPGQIINMNPQSDPRKRIAYHDVQDAFRKASENAGFDPIVFDELWLEHREFISNPLLQEESAFYDLLEETYRYETDGTVTSRNSASD